MSSDEITDALKRREEELKRDRKAPESKMPIWAKLLQILSWMVGFVLIFCFLASSLTVLFPSKDFGGIILFSILILVFLVMISIALKMRIFDKIFGSKRKAEKKEPMESKDEAKIEESGKVRKMGKKWISVVLHKPLNFSGRFERTITVPNICCKCLSVDVAMKEDFVDTSFQDPPNKEITYTVGFGFPYCENCYKRIMRLRDFFLLLIIPLIFIMGYWEFETNFESREGMLLLFLVILPLICVFAYFDKRAKAVKMWVEPENPMYEYIGFSFKNRGYAEKFRELNKDYVVK